MEASTCTTSMFSPKGVWGLDGAGDLLTREGRGFTVQWVERRNSGHWSLKKDLCASGVGGGSHGLHAETWPWSIYGISREVVVIHGGWLMRSSGLRPSRGSDIIAIVHARGSEVVTIVHRGVS